MAAKKTETKAAEQHICPNCGFCPHCGRSDQPQEARPYPLPGTPKIPQRPYGPIWVVPYPGNPWGAPVVNAFSAEMTRNEPLAA